MMLTFNELKNRHTVDCVPEKFHGQETEGPIVFDFIWQLDTLRKWNRYLHILFTVVVVREYNYVFLYIIAETSPLHFAKLL